MIRFATWYKNGMKREFKTRKEEGMVKGREKNEVE